MPKRKPLPAVTTQLSPAAFVAKGPWCGDCKHWSEFEPGPNDKVCSCGQCRALPPAYPTGDLTYRGPVRCYPVTLSETPACGLFHAR